MNYLWGGMIVIGVIFGALHGGFGLITEAAVDSAKEAVNLAIAMAGVVAMWSGLMEIAQETGFCHGNYLSQQFKRKTGMTPAQFRKKNIV